MSWPSVLCFGMLCKSSPARFNLHPRLHPLSCRYSRLRLRLRSCLRFHLHLHLHRRCRIKWLQFTGQLRIILDQLTCQFVSCTSLSSVCCLSKHENEKTNKRVRLGSTHRGPVIHAFHNFLDLVLFKRMEQTSMPVVIAKVVIDQFIFTPIFTSVYFYTRALAEDKSMSDTTALIRNKLSAILRKNWTVWIPVNVVNFLFVPLDLRVLFGSVVAFFWNSYLISQASTNVNDAVTR